MSPRDHADLETLSAFVDGEAPEWADHVAACPACRATAAELRSVAAAVGDPVTPPTAERDRALAAALDAARPPHTSGRARAARRRSDWRWALPAVAALVAGVVGVSALVTGTRPSDRTTVAGPSVESLQTDSAPAGPADAARSGATAAPPDALAGSGGAAGAAAAPPGAASEAVPPTDLGEVPDAATLLARVRPLLAGPAPTTTATPQRVPTPNVVGTRPCEEEARGRARAFREVVYFATARHGGAPAVVLGFASGTDGGPVTLLLLARDGCVERLRADVP